jgi:cation diffusion facilitator family transporter
MAATEGRGTVLAALGANSAIAVGKLAAGLLTGSGAMLAEGVHSLADAVNQVFLLVGLNLSDTHADEEHPHGYGKETFFWSFLAAIFIFVAGATFSIFEGTRTLVEGEFHERSTTELVVAFVVLGLAFVFEAITLFVAVRALHRGARRRGWTFWQFVRHSPDMTTKTVFWEDSAATAGLLLAAGGLSLAEATRSVVWDGLASLAIGVLLAGVALMLGSQTRRFLLGAAAHPEVRQALRDLVLEFDEVENIVRLLTMQLGTRSVLVTGNLQVVPDLTTEQIEDLILRIDDEIRSHVPEVSETFWELRRHPLDTAVGRRLFEAHL